MNDTVTCRCGKVTEQRGSFDGSPYPGRCACGLRLDWDKPREVRKGGAP